MSSLFSDFLTTLGVPHTRDFSDSRFAAMPFQTMFGLSKLLESYGIPSEGVNIADKSEIAALTPPFLADTGQGFVIVTARDDKSVTYLSQGQTEVVDMADFKNLWNGIVLLAFPDKNSSEPDYRPHRLVELINQGKKWLLWAIVAALVVYLFVVNRLYDHASAILIAVFDIAGLVLTFMLIQKTVKIRSHAADRVCGVLEEGGCDSILELKASSFFGIFKWSEVGFAYFSVSLAALLVFPGSLGALALCNLCCLPFTLWSIWYQKFHAKVWCTLCVSVQSTLWLLFFSYLWGGWLREAFPVGIDFFLLIGCYVAVLLAMNSLDNSILKHIGNETDTTAQS